MPKGIKIVVLVKYLTRDVYLKDGNICIHDYLFSISMLFKIISIMG